jgi:hypothetical protein
MERTLDHYENINKVFWYILNDMPPFKQNEKIPCIYVENDNGKLKILDFDNTIENDGFTYTAWRRFLGETYKTRIDVLLIKNSTLYTLDGKIVDFNTLGRSDIWVDQKYLARTGYANK